MRDGVAPGVGTGSGTAWERVALAWRGPLPEGAKLGAAGVRDVAALLEPGAKDGGFGATVVSSGVAGGFGATVVSSGVAGGFGTGALRRAEDAGVGTGYAPLGEDAGVGTGYAPLGEDAGVGTGYVAWGEDDGVGTGCVAWGEDDGFCDESAWRVRNDLRAADPGANDGGGVGAERLGNSEDGSRWG